MYMCMWPRHFACRSTRIPDMCSAHAPAERSCGSLRPANQNGPQLAAGPRRSRGTALFIANHHPPAPPLTSPQPSLVHRSQCTHPCSKPNSFNPPSTLASQGTPFQAMQQEALPRATPTREGIGEQRQLWPRSHSPPVRAAGLPSNSACPTPRRRAPFRRAPSLAVSFSRVVFPRLFHAAALGLLRSATRVEAAPTAAVRAATGLTLMIIARTPTTMAAATMI